jgi:ribosomal protein S18 acetylase RimI-like enzyme
MIVQATAADLGPLQHAVRLFRHTEGDAVAFLAHPGTLAFVAVEGVEVEGWCWGYYLPRPDGRSMAYLHEIEVAGSSRRRRIGWGLLQAFLAAAHGLGASKMFLFTSAGNAPARTLYEKAGGRPHEQGATVTYWFALT